MSPIVGLLHAQPSRPGELWPGSLLPPSDCTLKAYDDADMLVKSQRSRNHGAQWVFYKSSSFRVHGCNEEKDWNQ